MNKENLESERLLSLDFFRGMTMFLLVVAITGFFSFFVTPRFAGTFVYWAGEQFNHHAWNGLRFWDLIQPYFMFIVGVAMPLSYAKRRSRGESHASVRKHILLRCLILLLLGWWLYCIPSGRITFFFQNVLAQLSVTILIAFFVMQRPVSIQIIVSLALLLGMEMVYRTFPVGGFDQPFVADHNFGAWLDLKISGQLSPGHWVSVNAIPTAVHTIWGVLAGKLLMGAGSQHKKLLWLTAAGVAALAAGYALTPVTPIIKRIATSTFVLVSGGWTLLSLALCYWVVDMLKFRRGVRFFAIVGMNPLFIYLFAEAGGAELLKSIAAPLAVSAFHGFGADYATLAFNTLASAALWGICYWMFKNRIFIKI